MSVGKTNINEITRTVGFDVSNPADGELNYSLYRVETRLDKRVEIRQIRQISQKWVSYGVLNV